jgi:hypothetical protein
VPGSRAAGLGRLVGVVLLLGILVTAALSATGRPVSAQEESDPARELADRYAPLVAVREQRTPCGDGEPFSPTTVESVLGRDDVSLVGPDGQVVTTAPTATDLFGLGEGYHLDLPGNPLDPGCSYEQWWDSMAEDHPPTIYARVTSDPGHPGKVVLQYWFWWIFNDWNDKHEGDWEMVQLVFDADTPEEALTVEPTTAVAAQHEGAQYEPWTDEADLERDGARMVAFPGAGSHASYFSSNRWFGKSAQTGFGCDDTRGPLTRLDPEVVLLPSDTDAITADDPFAWLTFTGRWGQKAPSFNNGPQGPATKTAWTEPVEWVEEEGRPTAVALPPLGTEVTDFFCMVSEEGSLMFVKALDSPLIVVVGVLLLLVALILGVALTRWRPSDPLPVRSPRRAGQLFTAAFRLQRRHPAVYGALGLVVLGGGALASLVQGVVLDLSVLGHYSSLADEETSWSVPVVLLAGAVVTLPVAAFVRTAAAAVVREIGGDRRPTFAGVSRAALSPPGGLLAATVLLALVSLGTVVHLLLPVVVWLVARWGVATPEAVAGGLTLRGALRRSTELTRGHRWRTLGVGVVAHLLVVVLGPLVGTVVLIVTDAGFGLVNLISAAVGMVLVPWAGTVMAMLREDLLCRATAGAAPEPETDAEDVLA